MQQLFTYKLKFTKVRDNLSNDNVFVITHKVRGVISPDKFAELLQQGISQGGVFVESWRVVVRNSK
jgi:hypothetical protein